MKEKTEQIANDQQQKSEDQDGQDSGSSTEGPPVDHEDCMAQTQPPIDPYIAHLRAMYGDDFTDDDLVWIHAAALGQKRPPPGTVYVFKKRK